MKKILTMLLCAVLVVSIAVSASAATVLKSGMRGSAVRELQAKLNELGYSEMAVDGIYGKATAAAVSLFQANNGLKVDGKAGPKTLKKLLGKSDVNNDPQTDDPTDGSVLRQGATGPAVRELQVRLRKLGYMTDAADSVYGKSTTAAVRSFQKLNGLSVDGVAGPNTQAVLNSESAVAFYVPTVYTTLRPGDSGEGVLKLQKKLAALGYDVIPTGYYNKATQNAVAAYQTVYGLTIDGIAGQKTQSSLFGK